MSFRNFLSNFTYVVKLSWEFVHKHSKLDDKQADDIEKFLESRWRSKIILNTCLYYYYYKLLAFYWMVFEPWGRIYYKFFIKPIMKLLSKLYKNLTYWEIWNVIFLILWYWGFVLGIIWIILLFKDFISFYYLSNI